MWQSHLSYHPRVGHTFTPNFRTRVAHSGGGYLLRTNGQGFRSEHDFVAARSPGTFRILLFGDSQAAGLGVSNRQRFGDLLEAAVPGLEVFNYALPGIGTDQQYLLYREFGEVEHDLVMIAPYVEDTQRVASRYLQFMDQRGAEVFYAKPYFELSGTRLQLQHVPAPKLPLRRAQLPAEMLPAPRSSVPPALRPGLQTAGRIPGLQHLVRRLSLRRSRRRPATADELGWQLVQQLLCDWVTASAVPVLLVPLPDRNAVCGSGAAANFQMRYADLAKTLGCRFHDPAPEIALGSPAQQAATWLPNDPHLSLTGHAAIARSLKPAIESLMLTARR